MSVAESNPLNQANGKPISPGSQPPEPAVIRGPRHDPLGYDTSDFMRCAAEMASRALSGANKEAVDEELRRVRARLGPGGQN
jgi:hypothetical protein